MLFGCFFLIGYLCLIGVWSGEDQTVEDTCLKVMGSYFQHLLVRVSRLTMNTIGRTEMCVVKNRN